MELSYDIFIVKMAWICKAIQKATRIPASRIRVHQSQIGKTFTTRASLDWTRPDA